MLLLLLLLLLLRLLLLLLLLLVLLLLVVLLLMLLLLLLLLLLLSSKATPRQVCLQLSVLQQEPNLFRGVGKGERRKMRRPRLAHTDASSLVICRSVAPEKH